MHHTKRMPRQIKQALAHIVRVEVGVALLCAAIVVAIACSWKWLQGEGESNSETLRNVVLLVSGPTALIVAAWRSIIADRQEKIARRNEVAGRYQRATEMFGSNQRHTRIGGAHALARIGQEHASEYGDEILMQFCAFVRAPPLAQCQSTPEASRLPSQDPETGTDGACSSDVQAVMRAISRQEGDHRSVFDLSAARLLDLAGSNLRRYHSGTSWGKNYTYLNLTFADLSEAIFIGSNFTGSWLAGVKCNQAQFLNCTFDGVNLVETDLSGTSLSYPQGLTQTMLDEAVATVGNPPSLNGAMDSETGKKLIWKERHSSSGNQPRRMVYETGTPVSRGTALVPGRRSPGST